MTQSEKDAEILALRHEVAVLRRRVSKAMANNFLGKLPRNVFGSLIADGERIDYPAGAIFYCEHSAPRAALHVTGLIRVCMSALAY